MATTNTTMLEPSLPEKESAPEVESVNVPSTSDNNNMVFIDEKEERRVRNKIDWVIMPLMAIVFLVQYIDKVSLGYAAIFGLIQDLNLKGNQYAWTNSIFLAGQLASEFPAIYLMSRLPLARFVGVTVIIWGGVCMCLAAPKSYGGFLGVRFALGFAEGTVAPAFVTITSMWYKKREHPMRVGIWYSCNGIAQVIAPLIMYGIGKTNTRVAQWQLMFLVCGAATIVVGIVFLVLMPSGPESAWFLTPDERILAKRRLQLESDAGDQKSFSFPQFKEAVLDVRTWLYIAFGIFIVLPSPVLVFASLIINSLGYDKFETLLYTTPSGAVQVFFIWVGIILCQIFPRRRCAIVIGLVVVPFTGVILLFRLPLSAGWGMIVASWLASVISNILIILLSLSASNVRGNTKKAAANALFFVGYSLGGILSALPWSTNHAPRYRGGLIMAIISWVALIACVGGYWLSCIYDNRKRQDTGVSAAFTEGKDITDKQDPTFKYSY